MKVLIMTLLVFVSGLVQANGVYRTYLLSKVSFKFPSRLQISANDLAYLKSNCVIPHYQTPKGNVFCRMEEYLTHKTNIWIKIGVK